jgi:hypothetical protein
MVESAKRAWKLSAQEADEVVVWLRTSISKMPFLFRLVHGAFCVAFGLRGLWDGVQLLRGGSVVEEILALLIVEPFSLYFLIAGLFEIAPDRVSPRWFVWALLSLKRRALIFAALLTLSVLVMLAWWLYLVLGD